MADDSPVSLEERLEESRWTRAAPGLAEAAVGWEWSAQRTTPRRTTNLGLVSPVGAARRGAALGRAPVNWAARRLPLDLLNRRPLDSPGDWVLDSTAYVVRDELAGLGPAAAEVGDIIASGLGPARLVEELRHRPIIQPTLPQPDLERLARRALPGRLGWIGEPLAVGAASQLHPAELRDGSPVLVRACRPAVTDVARNDARLGATVLTPLEVSMPGLRAIHLLDLMDAMTMQIIVGADARNEALNAVRLGLLVEEMGLDDVEVARPIPDMVTSRVAVFEAPSEGAPLIAGTSLPGGGQWREVQGAAQPQVSGLIRLTVEASIAHGRFHSDLSSDHVLSMPNGRVALVGARTFGEVTPRIRRIMLDGMVAAMSVNAPAGVQCLVELGAVPQTVDSARLADDLLEVAPANPLALLAAPQEEQMRVLRRVFWVLRRHGVELPVPVIHLLLAVLALRTLVKGAQRDRTDLIGALSRLAVQVPALRAEMS